MSADNAWRHTTVLLNEAVEALERADVGNTLAHMRQLRRLVLQGFVYGDGALEVAIRAPDATRFEGLREQIMLDATLQVEIGSTSYEGQEVIGRIRIRRSA